VASNTLPAMYLSPVTHGNQDGPVGGPADITLPAAITFSVTVQDNALLYFDPFPNGGHSEWSTPAGPVGGTTISEVDVLDSINMGTTMGTGYTAVAVPANPAHLPTGGIFGDACVATVVPGIPVFTTGFPLVITNNGTLPAANALVTAIAYPVSVQNPGTTLAPGIYAETVTVTAPNGQTPTPMASWSYCLTVGTFITTSIITPDEPFSLQLPFGFVGHPPLYIEAGTTQNYSGIPADSESLLEVNAVGSIFALPIPPIFGLPGIPFTETQTGPTFVTTDTNSPCAGGGVTPTAYCIESAPPATTPAGEYDPTWTITATGTAASGLNAFVIPEQTGATPVTTLPASAAFTLREDVTSGVNLFYYTSFSLFANTAVAPSGNLVTGAVLAGEPDAVPFSTDPIYSMPYPGGPALPACLGSVCPDWPGTGNTITLQFYKSQGSTAFTMQDGTPLGGFFSPFSCFGLPCEDVYIIASGPDPHLDGGFFAPFYVWDSGVEFLENTGPTAAGCFNFGNAFAPGICTLSSIMYEALADILAPGVYSAHYTLSTNNIPFTADIPQPSPTRVNIILTVTANPTIIVNPTPFVFTYNVGAPTTEPPSQPVTIETSSPSAPIGFTLTPVSASATVDLSANGATPSTSSISGLITGAGLTNCAGTPMTVAVSIGNLAALTTPGAYGGTLQTTIPAVNPCTGLANAPVNNSTVTSPVTVNVNSSPSISIGPSDAFNWTVGQPSAVLATGSSSTMTISLVGNDTYTVTSTCGSPAVTPCPWVGLTAPSPNSSSTSSTITVSIITATSPTAPGPHTATITVTGASTEFATDTVTLNVAAMPTVSFTGNSSVSYTYYAGDTDVTDINPDPFTVTVAASNTQAYPVFNLTATVNAGSASWCAVTNPGPGINAANPGSMKVTLTPHEAGLAVSATPYVCTITVAGGSSITSNTFTVNLTVSGQTLNAPSPNVFTFNMPTNATSPSVQHIAMTGLGTFTFNTTATVTTPVNGTWLASSPVNLVNGAGTLTLTATDTGLGNGQYTGTVAYNGPNNPVPFNTPVYLNVGTIVAAPTSVTWAHTLGFTTPTPAPIALSSQGIPLAFTVVTTPSASWLTCAVNTSTTPATLTVSYSPTGLTAAGSPYNGSCTINTTGSTNTLVIPVTLTVTSEPTLSASVGGGNNPVVNLDGVLGSGNNPTYTLTITGNGLPTGNTMPFTVTNVTSAAPGWLSVAPLSGNVGSAGTALKITVSLAALGANPQPATLDGSFLVSSADSSNTLLVTVILTTSTVQPFFITEVSVGSNVWYMAFPDQSLFGYYAFTSGTATTPAAWIDHQDMGYEYVLPADFQGNVYMYDLTSGHWWYTGSSLFPYIYDFQLGAWLYYFPSATNPTQHYSSNPRKFENLTTGVVFNM
jgi:hypothetical protein